MRCGLEKEEDRWQELSMGVTGWLGPGQGADLPT